MEHIKSQFLSDTLPLCCDQQMKGDGQNNGNTRQQEYNCFVLAALKEC